MADIHRTPQDVYALVIPESPLDHEYEPGEEVFVPEPERVERLEEHGWIENTEERGHGFRATLTHTGASIINYWRERQDEGDVLEILEQGVGVFVEEALENAVVDEQVENWEIVSMEDGELVLQGETADGVRITRTYNLVQQDEEHPQLA